MHQARSILKCMINVTSYEDACCRIVEWARIGSSRYVCAANVHMVMEAHDSAQFRHVINAADLVTPDGMPLVWGLRLLGVRRQERVCGPHLTLHLLDRAAQEGIPVGFYGGGPEVLDKLVRVARGRFPGIRIAYAYSPPFRPMTREEDATVVEEINASGVRILFVALGCPKQEQWMHHHKDRLQAVQIGVGAAFDFIAGTKRQAPSWMMHIGLEWLFRLMTEPRRLAGRYVRHNPRFLFLFAGQLLRARHK